MRGFIPNFDLLFINDEYSETGSANRSGRDLLGSNMAAFPSLFATATATALSVGPVDGGVADFVADNIPSVTGLPTDLIIAQSTTGNIDLSAAEFVDADNDILTITLTASGGSFLTPLDGAGVDATLVNSLTVQFVGLASALNSYFDTVTNLQCLAGEELLGDDAETISVTISDGVHSPVNGGTINIDAVEVPSFIVTTTEDIVDAFGGQTSLREAVALANSDPDENTITFATSLAGSTITLTNGQLALTSDVIIDGDNTGNDNRVDVTISGNRESGRIFDVSGAGTNATLQSLRVTGGYEANGGGGLDVGVGASAIVEFSTLTTILRSLTLVRFSMPLY